MGLTPLAIGSTTVSGGKVGNSATVASVPVSGGRFAASFATAIGIPKAANALTGVDGTLQNAVFYGALTTSESVLCKIERHHYAKWSRFVAGQQRLPIR